MRLQRKGYSHQGSTVAWAFSLNFSLVSQGDQFAQVKPEPVASRAPLARRIRAIKRFEDILQVLCLDSRAVIPDFNNELIESLLISENDNIRISSLRSRDGKMQILVYNISDKKQISNISFNKIFTRCSEILIDGKTREIFEIKDNTLELTFDPFEIKICSIE